MLTNMVGKLIVIDGTDGSGKKTQTQILIERLRREGHEVEMADFPQYGQKSAGMVEEYLNGKYGTAQEVGPYRASILYAADRYAASSQIKKWLEEGKIVICNRYVSSNMGHQAGKIQHGDELDGFLDWLEQLEFDIFQIPRPDKVLLLYLLPEIGQQLVDKKGHRDYVDGKKRDIHEEDIEHLKDAAKAYLYVAKKYDWQIINCAPDENLRTIADISEEVWQKINEILNS